MKAKTFRDWLAESAESTGRRLPKNITLITTVSIDAMEADSGQTRVESILSEMKAGGLQIILVLPVPVLDLIYIWIGWDDMQEWGYFANHETGLFEPKQFRKVFGEHGFSIDSMSQSWQAVNTLIRKWKDATVEDLVWLIDWCNQYGDTFSDLVEKIKEHPNWPEDMTDWALDEW